MTSKTKYILLGVTGLGLISGGFVLVAAMIIGIGFMAAQAEENKSGTTAPTAAKNPFYKESDVEALIEFHEWASETEFSKAQRAKFEMFLAKEFEKDASKARKETDGLIEAHERIKAAEKDVQDLTRKLLVQPTIEEFRRKNDDFSRFMLAIYEKNGYDANISHDKTAAEGAKGSMPREFVGVWTRSEGSGYIDYTGKTQYKSGADHTYRFSADGTVKYSLDKNVLSVIQCKIVETKHAKGTASIKDETLTINFGEMKHTSSNSCEADDNFDKTLPPATISLNLRLKTEYETTRLCFYETGGEQCYDKSSD